MIVKGTADQFSPDKHLFSCIFMLLLKMCVCRKNCINYLFSKSVEWIYFMMIIITCLMPQCSASQLWIGLAVHVHVLPRQLGIGRICSSGFAGSKVSPVFQASVDQFPHAPFTADWGCGLYLIFHLTLCATLQEKGTLNTASNQCFRLVGSGLPSFTSKFS